MKDNRKDDGLILVIYETTGGKVYPKLIFEKKELVILQKSSLVKRIILTEQVYLDSSEMPKIKALIEERLNACLNAQ